MKKKLLPLTTPGEVLNEEFLISWVKFPEACFGFSLGFSLPSKMPRSLLRGSLLPLGITQYRLAKELSIPARRINEIVLGKRAISPDTALRLGKYFDVSAEFWLNLQVRYDLQKAERASAFLSQIHPYRALMAA
jgi:addiction module HigA family antidote